MNKKVFYKGLFKAVIISIVVALVAIFVVKRQGIEDNPDAISWALLFFGMLEIHILDHIYKPDTY